MPTGSTPQACRTSRGAQTGRKPTALRPLAADFQRATAVKSRSSYSSAQRSTIAEDPTAAATQWARERLATRSASSLRHALTALRGWDVDALARELRATEEVYLERLMKTRDAAEGIDAFLAKRPPAWRDQ